MKIGQNSRHYCDLTQRHIFSYQLLKDSIKSLLTSWRVCTQLQMWAYKQSNRNVIFFLCTSYCINGVVSHSLEFILKDKCSLGTHYVQSILRAWTIFISGLKVKVKEQRISRPVVGNTSDGSRHQYNLSVHT